MAATTAGTVVAAVLEGSGYYSQAQILDTFQRFFSAGGTLVFVLVCMTGLFLTVLQGSYRPMLALVLGPSLFYFLLEYRVPLDPPAKRLGGGQTVDVERGVTESNRYAQALPAANVSWFFSITSRVSSQIVHYTTNFILQKADTQELKFLARKTALSAILEAEPSSSELQSMLSFTILDRCSGMLSGIYNLSSLEFSDAHRANLVLLANNNPQATAAIGDLDMRKVYWQQFAVNGGKVNVTPSDAMKDFIKRQTSMFLTSGAGINYAPILATDFPSDPARFVAEEVPNLHTTCDKAMNVFGDAAMLQGDWIHQFVIPGTLEGSLNDTPENREKLCRAISDKIFQSYEYTNPCKLGQIAMLYMVRNLFSSMALNSAAQRAIDRSSTTNNSLSDKCRDPEHDKDLDELCRTITITQPNPGWEGVTANNLADVEQGITSRMSLKTSIVSYAYNIPYYQGVLLYVIATLFPFWAVIVLMPGRASMFLLLPLAFFWVKSWDIGFALVYILDGLLWNILPSPKLLQDGYNQWGDLPELLRDLGGADLGYDMLAHYYFVAMCLVAVPLISGYAILRGRGEVMAIVYREPAIKSQLDEGQIDPLEYNQERDLSAFQGKPSVVTPDENAQNAANTPQQNGNRPPPGATGTNPNTRAGQNNQGN